MWRASSWPPWPRAEIRTLQQTIAATICHLKMVIDAFKGACQDVLPSSLMNKEEMHVQGILLQINTVPWSRLMFKFEEGLVSETALHTLPSECGRVIKSI